MKLPRLPKFLQTENSELILRLLRESLRPNWKSYAAAFLFMAALAASVSLTAWMMRDVVNEIFLAQDASMLWVITLAVFGLFAMRGWSTYMSTVLLARVGNRIVADNQRKVYDRLLLMDLGFFSRNASSDLITRLSYGSQAARAVVDLIVQSAGRDFLMLLGLTTVMVIQAPLLSLFAVFIGPPAIIGVVNLSKRVKALMKVEMLSLAELIAVVQETTHGTRILKAFGLENYMRARMDRAVRSIEQRTNKIAALQARTAPMMDMLSGLAIAAVIFLAGWQAIYHGQSPGAFMSFITALLLAYEPAKRLARLHVQLTSNLVMARMMMEMLDMPVGATERDDLPPIRLSEGKVEFRDVSFAYRADAPVLDHVSFAANHGKRVALVGPTGAGKSTILALLQRFYDPASGVVAVDGQDVRTCSADSLRAVISYVSQDTYLFTGTVRENIRLGRLTATDEEVEQAARDAFAEDFILELPNGYDSSVGENGIQLSGGQRQRIAIARALLKEAPIILLDEATSSLDSETEFKIREAVNRLTRGRTTLVIAHRLSTVVDADWILVMEQGRIVEQGRHRELLSKGGLYERLCKLQFNAPDTTEGDGDQELVAEESRAAVA